MSNGNGKRLYVGNLPWAIGDDELKRHFEKVGSVVTAKVIIDKETEKSKGFGFVEMSTEDEAQAAIREFHMDSSLGRELTVNVARPMERRDGDWRERRY